jgi:NADP-dependent 3-hydroxy acid dehydrogenase YdfG
MCSQWKAVVTGASSGIGKAIALALAAQGATLFLIGRKREALDKTAESARATAAKVLTCQTDLTQDENIREIVDRLWREFTSIDLLVHAAGMISIGLVENAPIEDLDRQYRINVRVPFHLTQALLPMVKTARGQIVFLNSLVGLDAKGGSSQYSATKHALKALADSLRQEVNGDGVRVLSVFLGRSATPMQAQLQQMEGSVCRPRLLIQPNDIASVVMNAVSLSRTAEVTDITIRHAIKTA